MIELMLGKRPTPTRHAAEWTPLTGRPGYGGRVTRAGVVVDEDLALTYSAVFCASRIIAETESSLPLFLMERLKNDDRRYATDSPLFDLLHSAPNPQMGSMAFREGRTLHQVNWGGGFGEIERESAGDLRSPVVAIWPIHPSRAMPSRPGDRYANGNPVETGNYLVRNNDGTSVTLRPEEMLHVPGVLSEDGIWGKSVVQYARESVGMGIAHVRSGATSFGSGNTPRVVLTLPGLKTEEKRREYRKEWKELYGSPDSGEIVILPVDGKLDRLSFSQVDNQYVESGLLTIKDISRFWRVPLHMLMEMESGASRASIEQVGIEFITYSILPWLKRWEDQCSLKLLTREQRGRFFVEHQLQGLLRGDTAARMEGYRQAIMMGLMTINECRRLENLNGIGPDGDIHYLPANLTTAERMREGPQLPEPGAPVGPGSDHTGAPGTEPLTRAARQEIERQLQTIVERNTVRLEAPTPVVLPAPAPEPTPEPPAPSAILPAARAVLVDVLARTFRKEANAAGRAAKETRPGSFAGWLTEFYDKHREMVATALGSACEVVRLTGVVADPVALAKTLTLESVALLHTAYETLTPVKLAEMLAAWPTDRAERTADGILAGTYVCGGEGSGVPGPCPTVVKDEKKSGKEKRTKEEKPSAKAQRAKDAHHLVDKDIQRYAEEHNEPHLAKKLGGESEPDNKPYDVAIKNADDSFKHGVELKTMVDNKNNKLTMKGSAQDKKTDWEVATGATFHTVVYDDQKVYNAKGAGKHGDVADRVIYYRRGGGSFRVEGMHVAKNEAELKKLMDTPDDKLPSAAQPTAQWKERQQAAVARAKPAKGKKK